MEHHYIESRTIENIDILFNGHLTLISNLFNITADKSELLICDVPVKLNSFYLLQQHGTDVLKANGHIPMISCQKAYISLPGELKGRFSGFNYDGTISSVFNLDIDWNNPRSSIIDFEIDNQCECIDDGYIQFSKFHKEFIHRPGNAKREYDLMMDPESTNWTGINNVPSYLVYALVTSEDETFPEHKGVSVPAIKKAVMKNLQNKNISAGASTITMQLVKNLFHLKGKTIARKVQEIIISQCMECALDKDTILELYLNIVEFGPDIYGIKKASFHYFNKAPKDLTLLESIFLIKMLPNPVERYYYFIEAKKNHELNPQWQNVLNKVARRMFQAGYINKEEMDEVFAEELFTN